MIWNKEHQNNKDNKCMLSACMSYSEYLQIYLFCTWQQLMCPPLRELQVWSWRLFTVTQLQKISSTVIFCKKKTMFYQGAQGQLLPPPIFHSVLQTLPVRKVSSWYSDDMFTDISKCWCTFTLVYKNSSLVICGHMNVRCRCVHSFSHMHLHGGWAWIGCCGFLGYLLLTDWRQ